MSIQQALFASSFQFNTEGIPINLNGGVSVVNNYTAGLFKRSYSGYFADDVNWFSSQVPTSSGADTSISINNIGDLYSVEWTGYYYASVGGTYQFSTYSDDSSLVWLGTNAISGYSLNNLAVDNRGLHGGVTAYSPIYNLETGKYYPIRIQFGENTGGDVLSVSVNYMGYGFNPLYVDQIAYNYLSAEGF